MFATPYVVCMHCAHQLTVTQPLGDCENCGANSTFLAYYADPGDADEASEEIVEDSRRGIPGLAAQRER